jgi:hypothetical protein
MTGIFPYKERRESYPRKPLEELSAEIAQFASKAVSTKDSVIRDFRLNLVLRGNDTTGVLGAGGR